MLMVAANILGEQSMGKVYDSAKYNGILDKIRHH
jgi:hypothetical protein